MVLCYIGKTVQNQHKKTSINGSAVRLVTDTVMVQSNVMLLWNVDRGRGRSRKIYVNPNQYCENKNLITNLQY